MTGGLSLDEWYTRGTFAPFVRDRRVVASTPIWMFDVCQPAGEFPDPPIAEMVLIQDKMNARTVCDLGAGRFFHKPGGIVVVPPVAATEFTVSNPHHIRVLGFSPQTLAAWTETTTETDFGNLHAASLTSTFVHHLLDRVWDTGRSDGVATALYSDAILITLFVELLREARREPPTYLKGGLAPWQVRRCNEYLDEHASQNIGIEELAAVVGLSPFHFARAFKQSMGLSPHQYQMGVRLRMAKALLETTEAPVTQIAFDVGYESSQALARLFRRHVGLSPSDYRRQHRL